MDRERRRASRALRRLRPGVVVTLATAVLLLGGARSARAVVINEFPLPSAYGVSPVDIVAAPDGALWFTLTNAPYGSIGRMTPDGAFSEFLIPTPLGNPRSITVGPDGALWFTEAGGNRIGRITPSGALTQFPIPTARSMPLGGITAGPDGALWFTQTLGNRIGRITTAGVVTEFPLPTANSGPGGITLGPDGALWFTQGLGNRIGRITTGGVITEFPLPAANSGPGGITVGPDGALWFTEHQGNRIGRITTAGVITEFPTPGRVPMRITAAPDGALWFTASDVDSNIGRIGRITTAGVVTDFRTPSVGSWPLGIVAGPDGALWFTELNAEQIGRVRIGGTIFTDVPTGQPFAGWIEALVTAGVTSGCSTSPPQYCPDAVVTRAQMAVFLLRAKHGAGYSPPPATGTKFADVPVSQPFAPWIEALIAEGITGGCATNPPQYCPDAPITRAQMAVFLLRAKNGAGYSPPAATGAMFTDVPASQPLARWIEQLAREGITGGCGQTTYCPDAAVTRAAMAVFLVRTFNLPM
jgi:virginiamycin B lyase